MLDFVSVRRRGRAGRPGGRERRLGRAAYGRVAAGAPRPTSSSPGFLVTEPIWLPLTIGGSLVAVVRSEHGCALDALEDLDTRDTTSRTEYRNVPSEKPPPWHPEIPHDGPFDGRAQFPVSGRSRSVSTTRNAGGQTVPVEDASDVRRAAELGGGGARSGTRTLVGCIVSRPVACRTCWSPG